MFISFLPHNRPMANGLGARPLVRLRNANEILSAFQLLKLDPPSATASSSLPAKRTKLDSSAEKTGHVERRRPTWTGHMAFTSFSEEQQRSTYFAKYLTSQRDSGNSKKRRRTSGSIDTDLPFTVVYTDGACTNNGFNGAAGGIGVYWGPNDSRNVSEPLPPGRQTNNRAEILACARAIEQATNSKIKRLEIRTDSRFTIRCVTEFLGAWLKNGWVTKNRRPVLNKEELLVLIDRQQNFEHQGGRVKFVHVSAHSGEPGNEAADNLAVQGIRKAT